MRVALRVLVPSVALSVVGGPSAALAEAAGTDTAGTTVLTVDAGAAKALRAERLRIAPAGTAAGSAGRIALPVASASVGARTRIVHGARASLRIRVGRRSVVAGGLQLALTGARGSVTAKVAGRRVTLLALRGARVRTAQSGARVLTARVSVAAPGARRLGRSLAAARLRAGSLGTLRSTLAATAPPVGDAPAPPSPPIPPAVPVPPAPEPLPPAPGPVPPAPEAVDPSADWTIRGSWLNYLAAGGGSVTASGAERTATGSYRFPVATGTIDATTGAGTVRTSGAVRFAYPGHGIDMEFGDFAFELDGTATPRVTAVFTDRNSLAGSEGDGVPRRIDFGTLDLTGIPAVQEAGQVVLRRVPVLLSAEAAAPFLYYRAGEPFGAMTIRADSTR